MTRSNIGRANRQFSILGIILIFVLISTFVHGQGIAGGSSGQPVIATGATTATTDGSYWDANNSRAVTFVRRSVRRGQRRLKLESRALPLTREVSLARKLARHRVHFRTVRRENYSWEIPRSSPRLRGKFPAESSCKDWE